MLLDLLKAHKTCHSRLGSNVSTLFEGAVDVRIVVWISYREIEHLNTRLNEPLYQHICFGEVELTVGRCAKSVRVGNHIADAEACNYCKILGHGGLYGANRIKIKPRSVLKRAAVSSLAVECGEKLLEKVAVAALYVNSVKARFNCKKRGFYVESGYRVEIFVGHDVVVGDRTPLLINRVSIGNHRNDALSARVGELKHHKGFYSALCLCRPTHIVDELFEGGKILLGQTKLTLVGSSLGADGARLEPDKSHTRARRLHILVYGELAR